MTTQRGENPVTAGPEDQQWYTRPVPRTPGDDAPSSPALPAVQAAGTGAGTPWVPPGGSHRRSADGPEPAAAGGATRIAGGPGGVAPVGSTRAERRRAREAAGDDTGPLDRVTDVAPEGPGADAAGGSFGRAADTGVGPDGGVRDHAGMHNAEDGPGPAPEPRRTRRRVADEPLPEAVAFDGFDPGDTGTWKVRDVVPGADGGRRNTTILRYLLGLLAVDHVRTLTRWAFAVPVVGLVLLVVRPRWIGLAVFVLGILLILGRRVAARLIARRSLPRRYRPVEDDLRAAVEAGKANLRGELRRVGMPSSALAIVRSVVRLGSSDSRSDVRSRLRDIEIDRVLPRAQLDRALRVLDGATAGR